MTNLDYYILLLEEYAAARIQACTRTWLQRKCHKKQVRRRWSSHVQAGNTFFMAGMPSSPFKTDHAGSSCKKHPVRMAAAKLAVTAACCTANTGRLERSCAPAHICSTGVPDIIRVPTLTHKYNRVVLHVLRMRFSRLAL
jgi:hypothetical protein